jgi:hypothetical protein
MEFSNVEIKGVDLDETMVRAVAKQAERVRRTRVIHTEGALHAAETFLHPARQLAQPLRALQPRYMQALTRRHSSTLVSPMPMDIIDTLME